MNIEGIFLGSAFMLLVGSFVFMIIGNLPKGLRLLAKGFLILGAVMMASPIIMDYYFPELEILKFGRVLSYVSFHLGTITIIYGKIYVAYKDVKYKKSKWKPVHHRPLLVYIITYLITQIVGYGMNIDALKEVIITESSTQTSPFGVPLILSLVAGGVVYYSIVQKKEVS